MPYFKVTAVKDVGSLPGGLKTYSLSESSFVVQSVTMGGVEMAIEQDPRLHEYRHRSDVMFFIEEILHANIKHFGKY